MEANVNGIGVSFADGLSEAQMMELEQRLLSEVPYGEPIGNRALMRLLGWPEAKFWHIRDRLIDKGHLEKGRGKGGSVRRVVQQMSFSSEETQIIEANDSMAEPRVTAELELYQPIAGVLRSAWARDNRLDAVEVKITAKQGKRDTGGKWSRPDVTMVCLNTFAFVPGKHLDVITFEVKPSNAIDVTAVYEALSHRRAATHAYVVFHTPGELLRLLAPLLEEICLEAKRHKIGVITVTEPGDYEQWDVPVEAERLEPDPSKLNDFIATQLSDRVKERLQRWYR